MYKLVVLALFVALANCDDLDGANGYWYPIAFFLPGEDLSSVYQVCGSTLYTKSNHTFNCGYVNVAGGLQSELDDGLVALVPALEVHNYEEAIRKLRFLSINECQYLNVLRFVGKYMIAYNIYDTEKGVNMFLMSKEVPTQADLDAFIESVDELNRSEDAAVICTQEVKAASDNRRAGSRDPKKSTNPLKVLQRKMFAKH